MNWGYGLGILLLLLKDFKKIIILCYYIGVSLFRIIINLLKYEKNVILYEIIFNILLKSFWEIGKLWRFLSFVIGDVY